MTGRGVPADIDPSFLPAVARALVTGALLPHKPGRAQSPPAATLRNDGGANGATEASPTTEQIPTANSLREFGGSSAHADTVISEYLLWSLAETRFDMDFLRSEYPSDEAHAFSFGGVLAHVGVESSAVWQQASPRRRRVKRTPVGIKLRNLKNIQRHRP